MEFKHTSVLLEETLEGLRVRPDGIYVDGTLGGAGHAAEVCKKLSAKGRFIGIDQDQDAIIAASERLKEYNHSQQLLLHGGRTAQDRNHKSGRNPAGPGRILLSAGSG